MSEYRVSIDIGGTFTDCTIVDEDGAVWDVRLAPAG